MELAAYVTELPGSTGEEVEDALGQEGDHQQEIRHGQIDHQHVGRRSQRRIRGEDLQHHVVTAQSNETCNTRS